MDLTVLIALFWKKICLLLYSFWSILSFNTLNMLKMRLDIPQELTRCLIFVTHLDSWLASPSLKALRKKQSSFTKGFLCNYLKNCVSMLILKGRQPSSTNTFELFELFLTPSICLQSVRWNFSIFLKLFWSLGSPQLSQAKSTTGLMVVSIRFKFVLTVFPSDLHKNRWVINHLYFSLY